MSGSPRARLGILMLETRFPRPLGDMGNADTWPFPVTYRVVRGASPQRVVRERASGLLEPFLEAAVDLVAQGADGLATTCGFLSLYQQQLAARAGVPVAASSLMQVPMVQAVLPPGRRVGILTIDSTSLTRAHLVAAGIAPDTPIVGTENGRELTRALLGNESTLDIEAARRDMLDAGADLVRRHADIGAIVLECTNMSPYSASLRDALGLPVYDIYGFITWFHAGLQPRAFAPSPPS